MLHQIDHVNIVVKDLEASVAFYRDVLGLRETMRARLEGDWIEQVTGVAGVVAECVYLELATGTRLELLAFEQPANGAPDPLAGHPPHPGMRHIAFRVEDIHAVYTDLKARGVEFVGPPVAVPTAIHRHHSGRKWLCYFHGPEGVLLEICEFIAAPDAESK